MPRTDPQRRLRRPGGGGAQSSLSAGDGRHSAAPAAAAQALIALRRQRVAARLHRLGPRAIAELIGEIGPAAWDIAERYAAGLSPELLRAVGADSFPPVPLHLVAP